MRTILTVAALALSTVAHGSVAPLAAERAAASPIAQALDEAIAAGAERARSDALLKVSAALANREGVLEALRKEAEEQAYATLTDAKVRSVLDAGDARPWPVVAVSVPLPDTGRAVRF